MTINIYQESTRTNTTIISIKNIERVVMRDTTNVKNIGRENTVGVEAEQDMNPDQHIIFLEMIPLRDTTIHHIVEKKTNTPLINE